MTREKKTLKEEKSNSGALKAEKPPKKKFPKRIKEPKTLLGPLFIKVLEKTKATLVLLTIY